MRRNMSKVGELKGKVGEEGKRFLSLFFSLADNDDALLLLLSPLWILMVAILLCYLLLLDIEKFEVCISLTYYFDPIVLIRMQHSIFACLCNSTVFKVQNPACQP